MCKTCKMCKLILSVTWLVAVMLVTGCTPFATVSDNVMMPPPPPPRPEPPAPPLPLPPPRPPEPVVRNDTIRDERTLIYDESKYVNLNQKFMTTPTVADLEVSDKKVTGIAHGPNSARDLLEKEAISKALVQREGADVLVGYTFYYKTSSEKVRTTTYLEGNPSSVTERYTVEPYLTVTVTGYPARYVNFRPYNSKTVGEIVPGSLTPAQ